MDAYGNYVTNVGTLPANPAPLLGFIQYCVGNPNSISFTAAPGSFVCDTTGNQLYRTADGTTWIAVA